MSQADGSIIIDTRIDQAGFSKGLNTMKSAAVAGATAIAAAIGAASVAVIKLGSEFEQANAKASTLFGDAKVDMTQYQGKMLELSTKTGLAASELGNTMYDALSAGIPASDDMSESLGFLEKNSKLAKAGFTDINTATTATAKVLNAYKMDVSETDRVHKVLMQTQNKGITTVNELGSVLSQVTPTASAMNVSFEQVGAALANMTAQGTPTAQATTQLNQLFAELGKKGTTGQKALEAAAQGTEYAGKSFQDLMKKGIPLSTVIDLIRKYADKNGKSMIDMFSSIESGKAALAVSGKNAKQYTENLKAMKTETDVVGDAYDKVTNTFKEKSAKVVNSLKNVGIAAYSKFEEPLKGAMDAAQDSVDKLSKEMNSGKLGESVDKIAEAFGGLIEKTADLAADVIPLVVSGFATIVDNGELVVAGVTAVGTAMAALKAKEFINKFQEADLQLKLFKMSTDSAGVAQAAMGGKLKLSETAVGLLTGQIKIAELATAAWSKVCSLFGGPLGVVAAAVLAVGAGIAAYNVFAGKAKTKTDENTIATKKLVEEYEDLTDTLDDNKKARDDAVAAAEKEVGGAEVLTSKLEELSKKENKSNAEKAQMKYYVDKLNEIMPELNLEYDKEKDALNKSTEAIRANIAAQKELALAKAYQENMAKVAQDMAEAEMKLSEATEQHERNEYALLEAQKKREKAFEELQKAGKNATQEQQEAWKNASIAEGKAQQNYDKTKTTVDGLKKKLNGLNQEYSKTDEFAQKHLDKADIEKALAGMTQLAKEKGFEIPKNVSESIRNGSYAVPKSVNEMQALISYDKMIEDAKKSGISIPKDISDGISNGSLKPSEAVKKMNDLVSFDKLILDSRRAGIDVPDKLSQMVANGQMKPKEAADRMQELVKFDRLINDAKKAGVDVPESIKNKIIEGKLKPQTAAEGMQQLVNFNTMLTKSKAAGYDIPESLKTRIVEGELKPQEAIERMESLVNFTTMAKEANGAGIKIPDFIRDGILEGKLKPSEAMEELNRYLKNAAKNAEPRMRSAGKENAKEYSKGVKSGKGEAETAGENLGSGVVYGATNPTTLGKVFGAGITIASQLLAGLKSKQGLETNSPSKKGKTIGKYATQGVINGATELLSQTFSAGVNVANAYLNGLTGPQGLDEHSPSKKGKKAGENATQGVINGANGKVTELYNAGIHAAMSMLNGMNKNTSFNMSMAGAKAIQKYMQGAKSKTVESQKAMSKITSQIAQKAVTNNSSNFEAYGKNVMSSLTKGMTAYKSKSISAVKTMVNGIIQTTINSTPATWGSQGKIESEYKKAGKALIDTYTKAIETESSAALSKTSAALEKYADVAKKQYDEIIAKRDALKATLSSSNELLTKKDDGTKTLTDLKKSKKEIDAYGKNLTTLKKSLPQELMEQITSMSFEDGKAYTDMLMKMSAKERDQYIKTWSDREKSIKSISSKYYANEINSLKNDYNNKVITEMSKLQKELENIGKRSVEGMAKGMQSKNKDLSKTSQSLANLVLKEFKKTLKIKSPSRAFEEAAGFIPEGAASGVKKKEKSLLKAIGSMSSNALSVFKDLDMSKATASIQEAIWGEQAKMQALAIASNKGNVGTCTIEKSIKYEVNQEINSAKALRPSEIAQESLNAIRRARWNI